MELIELNGITILEDKTLQLTSEQVESIFPAASDEYRAHMASGESRCLAVTKGEAGIKIVKLCRDMYGPTEPATAKEQSPKSIRVSISFLKLSRFLDWIRMEHIEMKNSLDYKLFSSLYVPL